MGEKRFALPLRKLLCSFHDCRVKPESWSVYVPCGYVRPRICVISSNFAFVRVRTGIYEGDVGYVSANYIRQV